MRSRLPVLGPPEPDQRVHARQVRPGDWIVIFGTASQVLTVENHPAYPRAVLLKLRPAGFAGEVPTLVPAEYEPVVLPTERTLGW